jgi:hypothetical protein
MRSNAQVNTHRPFRVLLTAFWKRLSTSSGSSVALTPASGGFSPVRRTVESSSYVWAARNDARQTAYITSATLINDTGAWRAAKWYWCSGTVSAAQRGPVPRPGVPNALFRRSAGGYTVGR